MSKQNEIWNNLSLIENLLLEKDTTKDVLVEMNLAVNSTNYKKLKTTAFKLGITVPTISITERTKKSQAARVYVPTKDMLIEHSTYSRGTIKSRIIAENLIEYKCFGKVCSTKSEALKLWKDIILQLEHKNGIADDNRIENLEFLCPNCHSLTETFGGGNKQRYENGSHKTCSDCGRVSKSNKCSKCSPSKKELSSVSLEELANDISEYGVDKVSKRFGLKPHEVFQALRRRQNRITSIIGEADSKYHPEVTYPDVEILVEKVIKQGYSKTGRELGVTDNAIRKHLIKHIGKENLPIKTKKKI